MKRRVLAGFMVAAMAMGLAACGSSSTQDTAAADTTAAESAADAAETTAAGAAEAAKDGEKKVLKVAMECAYAPYNWTQPDDSNGAVPIADSNEYAYGYDVMMAKKICEELGYDLQIVRLDWDSLIPALQSGQADCVIAGQSITQERLQAVDFSEPYYYATIVTLVKKDSSYADATSVADLAGATCTSQQSTIWYQNCLPQIPDANILAATASAPDMLKRHELSCAQRQKRQRGACRLGRPRGFRERNALRRRGAPDSDRARGVYADGLVPRAVSARGRFPCGQADEKSRRGRADLSGRRGARTRGGEPAGFRADHAAGQPAVFRPQNPRL